MDDVKLNDIQKQALERIRRDERLREYETELMVDWAFTDTDEMWEWICREDTDNLLEHAQTIRDEAKVLHGDDFVYKQTEWIDILRYFEYDICF